MPVFMMYIVREWDAHFHMQV